MNNQIAHMAGDKWMAGKRFVVKLHNYLLSEHQWCFLFKHLLFKSISRQSLFHLSIRPKCNPRPALSLTIANDSCFCGRFQLKKWKLLMLMLLLLTACWQLGHSLTIAWQLDDAFVIFWWQLKYSVIMQWLNDSFLSAWWQLCFSFVIVSYQLDGYWLIAM